jgi:hypothetical protein
LLPFERLAAAQAKMTTWLTHRQPQTAVFPAFRKDCLTLIPELIKKWAIDSPRLRCDTPKSMAAFAEPGIRPGQIGMR